MDHKIYLQKALDLATVSYEKGSVPIGALIVNEDGEILAEGYNEIKIYNDPTAHAEIVCMRKANKKVIAKFNSEATYLFTTLEPCFACGFFVTRTNIKSVVWALNDPYKGGIEFLKESDKLKTDFESIKLVAEPDYEMKEKSRELMRKYYLNKDDQKTADLFL